MEFLLDFILHIDQHMIEIVQEYHTWAYAILFLIIFCETVGSHPILARGFPLVRRRSDNSVTGMPLEINLLALILFCGGSIGRLL